MTNSTSARVFATVLAAAMTIGSVAVTTTSHAATGTDSTKVTYSDLNLSSEAGQRQLDRRIDRAAREMCGMNKARTGTRLNSREASDCHQNALRSVRERVARAIELDRSKS
jgi:UrcA family protein